MEGLSSHPFGPGGRRWAKAEKRPLHPGGGNLSRRGRYGAYPSAVRSASRPVPGHAPGPLPQRGIPAADLALPHRRPRFREDVFRGVFRLPGPGKAGRHAGGDFPQRRTGGGIRRRHRGSHGAGRPPVRRHGPVGDSAALPEGHAQLLHRQSPGG